jgi:ABC-type transport system involved in multi-copper enzyme maturation permease subunit
MATVTAGTSRPQAAPVLSVKGSIAGSLRSELTKIRSVRSTYLTLLVLVLASVGWAVADCAGEAAHWAQTAPQDKASFDPTQASVVGLALLGQLVIVVLGALVMTSEYSTGMMRTSLGVMPRRGVLYGSKAAVLAAVTLVIALITSFAAFFIGQSLLRSTHVAANLSQPGALRAVLASAFYIALSGLFAFALGAIVRSTAGAITAAFGVLFLLPQLAKALPSSWYSDLVRWLPGGNSVGAFTGTNSASAAPHLFSPWGEFAVFGGYTVILLIVGALLFSRRDA